METKTLPDGENKTLPDPLKNIIMRQLLTCDNATNNGEKCTDKFMYSVEEFLFSDKKDELKKIMLNCTKFCIDHISKLFINGEVNLGIINDDTKDKKIIPLKKIACVIEGSRNGNVKISLNYEFKKSKINGIYIELYDDIIEKFSENIDYLRKKEKVKIEGDYNMKLIVFKKGIIPESWWRFIKHCFKNGKLDSLNLNVTGESKTPLFSSDEKYTMSIGNLNIYDVEIDENEEEDNIKYLVDGRVNINPKI